MTTCIENCHPRGANCRGGSGGISGLHRAELDRHIDGISDAEPDPGFLERLVTMLKERIMSPQEAKDILAQMLPPRIINFPGTQEELEELTDGVNRTASRSFIATPMLVADKAIEDLAPVAKITNALGDRIARLYARGLPMREMVDQMAMEGYNADALLLGHTIRLPTAGDLEVGDLVQIDEAGRAKRADEGRVIGVALGDGLIRMSTGSGGRREMRLPWGRGSQVGHYGSIAIHASMAYGYGFGNQDRRPRPPPGQRVDGPQFKYTERFPKEVEAKAMELLRKFMSAEQYTAFIERADIELENKAGTHRLIINQNGAFKLLRGGRGAGIVMTSGNVRSYRFPLGDEIAAFLDWFRYRTDDLIAGWNCGNFGIVRDGIE